MTINATLINLYHICKRELWLHAHAIRMEHTSELVHEGKLIGEESYPQRADKNQEVEISYFVESPRSVGRGDLGVNLTAKIDFFDAKNGVVHETKKSDAREQAHVAQVQFYLYLLHKNNISASHGVIEYPKLRLTEKVYLTEDDVRTLERQLTEIQDILAQDECPPRLPKSKCQRCSYFEFCWVEDT